MRLVIPVALFSPQIIEAAILIFAPTVFIGHDRLGDNLGANDGAGHFNLAADLGNYRHLRHLARK